MLIESLRMHPPATATGRVCSKEYQLPNGHKIMPGETILIPMSAIQNDPAFFPEPEKFNPDRFDVDPAPGTYLPFGDGPRICIGKGA